MNAELGFRRILVATDFSPPADAALKQAGWLADATGATMDLAHVLPARQFSTAELWDLEEDDLIECIVSAGVWDYTTTAQE